MRSGSPIPILALVVLVACEDAPPPNRGSDQHRQSGEAAHQAAERDTLRVVRTQGELLAFEIASMADCVDAYRAFLNSEPETRELQAQAISAYFELVAEADLVRGYRQFLREHPSAPEAGLASTRLYEIALAAATKVDTVEAYSSYLERFEPAPDYLRDEAVSRAVLLIERDVEIALAAGRSDRDANYYAMKLLAEAIQAKNEGDVATFLIKNQTVLDSTLFADTPARFHQILNLEIKRSIEELSKKVDDLRRDIERYNGLVLEAFEESTETDGALESQIQTVITMQERIELQLDPVGWNSDNSAWINFALLGRAVIREIAPIKAVAILPVLAQIAKRQAQS